MIDIENALETLLDADATLTALLTGGIYARNTLGKVGLDPNNSVCSGAYALDDGFNALQPCLVIRVRSEVPDGERVDVPSQTASVTTVVEFYLYDETSYTSIGSARNRIYALLQNKTLNGIGVMTLVNRLQYYDESLDDAATLKDDYQIRYRRAS